MEWLNYHHLHYFWLVARGGSLARASAELRLAPSTVSAQIRSLQQSMGHELLARRGRGLVLTETGRVVFRYAEEIFSLGRELREAVQGKTVGGPMNLLVGVADVVPKLVVRRLLEPALRLAEPVRLVCREDKPERLFAELALQSLDIVLADAPIPPSVHIRAFSHLLGECSVTFLATATHAAGRRRTFPRALHGAPMILPTENTTLRRSLDQWFSSKGIRPQVVGEFEDSALLKVFGQAGMGIFPVPTVIAKEVQKECHVRLVGTVVDVRERFYVISVDRKLKHPAVVAICDEARTKLFG